MLIYAPAVQLDARCMKIFKEPEVQLSVVPSHANILERGLRSLLHWMYCSLFLTL